MMKTRQQAARELENMYEEDRSNRASGDTSVSKDIGNSPRSRPERNEERDRGNYLGSYNDEADYYDYEMAPRRYNSMQREDLTRPTEVSPSYKLSLPTFDGRKKWRTFIRQFEAITFQWNNRKKLQYLLSCLHGDAADFVFNLEEDVGSPYCAGP